MLGLRQRAVLAAVISRYIEAAQPVSSQELIEEFGFEVSPATIRNDLAYLEAAGLLTHVYTSSGRVPTDQGYRLFISELLEPKLTSAERRLLEQIWQERSRASLANLCDAMARCAHAYTLVVDDSGEVLSNSKLAMALTEPEFSNREFIMNFLELVDRWSRVRLEEENFWQDDPAPRFLVGAEAAEWLAGAPDYALAVMAVRRGPNRAGILLIGPKRLPYHKIAAALDLISQRGLPRES